MRTIIRPEAEDDYDKITKINSLAFGQENEGRLVEKLRSSENFIPELSLVAEFDDKIVGHILFTRIKIISEISEHSSLALAPMSVLPDYQNQGIGSQLVRTGLMQGGLMEHKSVIVLGHPEFYPRFGFLPASKWDIKSPFDVPDEVYMALELEKDALKYVHGVVEYAKAFSEG